MKKNKFLLKVCSILLSATLVFDGNAIAAFADDNTEANSEVVETVVDDEEVDSLGISLEELRKAPLLSEEIQTGKITKGEDGPEQKWYRYTMEDNGYFQVNFSANKDAKEEDIQTGWVLELYTEDDLEECICKEYGIKLSKYTSPILGLGKKELYVRVGSNSSLNSMSPIDQLFDISVTLYKDPNFELEDNDKMKDATEIKDGIKYTGMMYRLGDVDYYKYTSTKKGYFTFDFSYDPKLSDLEKLGQKWVFEIYNTDGNLLFRKNGIEKLSTCKLAYAPGTELYIKVASEWDTNKEFAALNQPYNITVNSVASDDWEVEDNNTTAKATSISLDKTVNASMFEKDDTDCFVLELSNKEAVNVTFSVDKGEYAGKACGYNVYVLDSNGKTLLTKDDDTIEYLYDICDDEVTKETFDVNLVSGKNYIKIMNCNTGTAAIGAEYSITVKSAGAPNPNPNPGPNPNPNPNPNENYTVSYNGLEGVIFNVSDFVFSYQWSKKMKSIKLPSKSKLNKPGFRFKGWTIGANKKKQTKITKKTKNGTTFTANWAENTYSVKYTVKKPDRGVKVKGKIKALKNINYTADATLSGASEITAEGYRIIGWTTMKNGTTVEYKLNQHVSKLTEKNKGKVKLYAVWEKIN